MKRSMTNEERLELLEKLVDDAFTIINCYMLSPGVEKLPALFLKIRLRSLFSKYVVAAFVVAISMFS